MADLGFSLDLNAAKSASKGGRIDTGIYDVTIEKAYVYDSKKGDKMLDLELRSKDGEVGFINRICIAPTWSTGSENFGYNLIQELAGVVGANTFTAVATTRKRMDAEEPANSIQELVGKTLKVAVYTKFDVYENKERKELQLSASFFTSGKTIEEAEKNGDAVRIIKLADKLADFHTDAHKAWSGTQVAVAATVDPSAAVSAPAPAASIFGAK